MHEDGHYWCSSALHLGLCLFSILINSVGSKSRGALVGVPDDRGRHSQHMLRLHYIQEFHLWRTLFKRINKKDKNLLIHSYL